VPTSKLSYAGPVIRTATNILRDQARYSVLDIGPGYGKYGLLLREYLGAGLEYVDAVEAESRYVGPRLFEIYDDVMVTDALRLEQAVYDRYDLVLLVDVIEHFTLTDGLSLLRRIHCPVVVTTPTRFFQNPESVEWPTEEHKSLWTIDDFPADRLWVSEPLEEEGLLVCLRGC
jgi:SAM-dependent methyltransferase